jgi:hypothetical protein
MRRLISFAILGAVWLCAMGAIMVPIAAVLNGEPWNKVYTWLLFGGAAIGAGVTITLAEDVSELLSRRAGANGGLAWRPSSRRCAST